MEHTAQKSKFGPKTKPLVERFWSRVEKTDSCWNWIGPKNNKGYGTLYDNDTKKKELAPRISWKLVNGSYPSGNLRHTCLQNSSCVNPAHLVEGTQHQNMLDRVRDGTIRASPLTDEELEDLKGLYKTGRYTLAELAQLYNISYGSVHNYVNDKTRTLTKERLEAAARKPLARIKARKISLEDKKEIVQFYREQQGLTIADTAGLFGVSESALGEWVRGNRMDTEPKKANQYAEIPDERCIQMVEEYRSGTLTQLETAQKYGCSKAFLSNVLNGRTRNHLGLAHTHIRIKPG